ncbi:MAG: 50S ribosomal protein L11 methyltransferase, partial [Clostridiales bacterium]|nr:50S ribosomal protein L11 methyltransferase [Clostridiales bacterium]
HIDLIDATLKAKDRNRAIIHLYLPGDAQVQEALSFLRERLEAAGIEYGMDTSVCDQEDWINNWKQYYKPTPIGNKLIIQPLWYDQIEANGRRILKLEPGLAFGTGTHTTTQLCIRLLEQAGVEGAQVLDIGCGSGILSIAALLLGAAGATGIDIDPVAVKTARENGISNGMEPPLYRIIEGDLLDTVSGR